VTLGGDHHRRGLNLAPLDRSLLCGNDPNDVIAKIGKIGDIWKSWGWYVIERDGFQKPYRVGYAPDGYSF
jgi:hypothetical protein